MALLPEKKIVGDILAPEIRELIRTRRNHEAHRVLVDLLDPEIADVIDHLEGHDRIVAFRLLSRERQADVFAHFEPDQQQELIDGLNTEQIAQLFNEMEPDDRVDFFEVAPTELAAQLMGLMHPAERAETQKILEYPEESIGRDLTPHYLTVQPEWTVQQALDHIRRNGEDAELLNVLYMVDEGGRLIDYIRLRRLLIVDPQSRCGDLKEGHVVSLQATDDREEAVRVMEQYDLPVLPVVDRNHVLVGIVTFDDVADVAEEEATEDMQKMGGMEALAEPYLSVSFLTLVRKRGIWLLILFFGELLTVSAMGSFEDSIRQAAILALFVPLIIASGGNSGSQAATLIIRSLALGELQVNDWASVMRREIFSGFFLGSMLGLCGLVVGTLVSYTLFHHDTETWWTAGRFGLAIGTALVGVVMVGTLTGSMLPFVLQRLGADPATSSTPFVATIADVTGIVIYFMVANFVLGITAAI